MSKLTPDIVEAFERVPYLRVLSSGERESLAAACHYRRLSRGSTLFVEDEQATGIFLILEGRIRIVRSSEDGREQVLHEERDGATLAETPVFGGGGYVGSAIAVDDSTVLFLPRPALIAALETNPASATEVIRVLANRVRTLARVIEDLSLRDVTARLAAYLVREMDRTRQMAFDLPPTREQLAAHIGTVREQASRALSHLRTSGVIELDGVRVRVTDAGRLRGISRAKREP